MREHRCGRLPLLSLVALVAIACSDHRPAKVVADPLSPLRPVSERGSIPADARIADYVLEAKLDEVEHRIEGLARVTWRNSTPDSVEDLAFHLYMNGFRAEDTAWMRSSQGSHRQNKQEAEGAWGFIDIRAVRLGEAPPAPADEVTSQTELQWMEGEDPSTMTVELPAPLAPGESISVELEFTTQLPKVIARTGYYGDFHAVGQWYPKIAVHENGEWQNHVFTYHDEFFADFGNYEVTLDLPAAMVVGATGVRTAEKTDAGRTTLTYEAEMVHDFAWMGDPEFVEHFGEYNGIRIRQLMRRDRFDDGDAHLATQVAAFESYERRFGPYPWSTLTIIHPPDGARGAGGMEYPTLFTSGNRPSIPNWVRTWIADNRVDGVFTTIHEFGHQYFQGMFAVREYLEPWLDEGMNTTSNILAVWDWLGDDPWLMRIFDRKLYVGDVLRRGIQSRAFLEPIDRPAASFEGAIGNYGATIYAKTAAVVLTLRNLVGEELFDGVLRRFADQQRFRHPRGESLEASLVAELGERVDLSGEGEEPVWLDVEQYLDQALRTSRQVNFTVLRVVNQRRQGSAGWHRDEGEGQLLGGEPPTNLELDIDELADDQIEAVLTVHRSGEFVIPVEIEVELESGEISTFVWDARETPAVFRWPGQRLRRATLDPRGKLLLEWNQLDNSALARGIEGEDDGLSRPLAVLAEALTLVVMGALGP